MSSFPILDLVAGMIFIYFLLSIINNSLLEIYYSFTKARAAMLRQWLQSLFTATVNNPSTQDTMPLWQAIIDHNGTSGLSSPKKATNYISAKDFSTALIDLLTANPRDDKHQNVPLPGEQPPAAGADGPKKDDKPVMTALPITLANIQFALDNNLKILPESLRRIFIFYASQAKNQVALQVNLNADDKKNAPTDMQLFSQQVEGWFDSMMQRLGGRFKKFSLWRTLISAVVITFCLNIDSVDLMHYLYDHPEQANVLANAEMATAVDTITGNMVIKINRLQEQFNSGSSDAATAAKTSQSIQNIIKNAQAEIAAKKCAADSSSYQLPLGWTPAVFSSLKKKYPDAGGKTSLYLYDIRDHFLGLLLTILAICLGAPFWFDVLGKVANLRSSVKPLSSVESDQEKDH